MIPGINGVSGAFFPLFGVALNAITQKTYIDFFEFTATKEIVRATTNISEHKMAFGVAFTNFVRNNPVEIVLEDVIIKVPLIQESRGEFDKGYTALFLELLRLQQLFVPILLKSNSWAGTVRLISYSSTSEDGTTFCNLVFRETPLIATFSVLNFSGSADTSKNVPTVKGK